MNLAILNTWVERNLFIIFLVLLVLLLILAIRQASLQRRLKKYKTLLRTANGRDLEEILIEIVEKVHIFEKNVVNFEEHLTRNEIQADSHFQHWNLLRFQAFENTGGDQSFALAILDGSGNGFVLSSIFGREESRVYCKSVFNGKSSYALSKEEQAAINKALGTEKKQ